MPVPGTHAPPTHAPLVTAFAANAPASTTAVLEVTIPAFGAERSIVLGWAPRATLPKVGDECLVAYDEGGNPWAVAWLNLGETPLVTALPSSPYNGQMIAYQNASMATAGVIWRLRYNAASGSAYKWEAAGGSPIKVAGTIGAEIEIPKTESVKPPGSPVLTIPLAGDYDVYTQTTCVWRAKSNCQLLIHPAETSGKELAGVDVDRMFVNVGNGAGSLSYAPLSGLHRCKGLGAGGTICVGVEPILGAEATKLQFFALAISALPVRVG